MSSLTDAIKTILEAALKDLHTCLPGMITKYDYTKKKAEIQPLIKTLYNDDTTETIPVISNVPVRFPGSSKTIIHFPLEKGDTGLIHFSEVALENWLSLGGEVDPGDPRRFDLSDAFFVPGLDSFNVSSLADNNEDFIAQYKGTGLRIKKNGNIEVGGSSFKKLIKEEFQTLFNNHVHTIAPTGPPGAPIGITSSPSKLAGTIPLRVVQAGALLHTFNEDLTNNEMTSKVRAQ